MAYIQNLRNGLGWKHILDIEPEFGYTVYRISENVNIVNEEEIQVGRNITFNISQARSSISGSEGNHILNITGGTLTIIQQPRQARPVERVLAGIRDNFNLTTDVFGGFVFPDEMDDIDNAPVYKTQLTPDDLETITNAIADYIRNHQGEFNLSNTTQHLT